MITIPVIDVLSGIAVHAMRGERKKYQPLRSVLCESTNPIDVALAFKSLGFASLYLADLDAILGKSTSFTLYKQIKAKTDLDLMVDAGIADVAKAEKVLEAGTSKVVIGTETLSSLDFVNQAVKSFGKNRVMVSIDLKNGKVVSFSENIKSMNAVLLAQTLEKIGVSQIILLDLDRVGTECGVNFRVLKDVLKKSKVQVFVGGGIRGILDLRELRNLGVFGTLLATVLHNGKLDVDELKSAGFL